MALTVRALRAQLDRINDEDAEIRIAVYPQHRDQIHQVHPSEFSLLDACVWSYGEVVFLGLDKREYLLPMMVEDLVEMSREVVESGGRPVL